MLNHLNFTSGKSHSTLVGGSGSVSNTSSIAPLSQPFLCEYYNNSFNVENRLNLIASTIMFSLTTVPLPTLINTDF